MGGTTPDDAAPGATGARASRDPGAPEARWTGYGAAAHSALRAAVDGAQRGDPLAPVTLVVPTNLCGVLARRALARSRDGARRGVAGLTVLTLDRLAELVAAPALTGQGRRPSTRTVVAAAWRRALLDQPLTFAPVADHPQTVAALVRAHARLRELSPSALSAVAGCGVLQRDLVLLHRHVTSALDDGWYDVRLLRDTARVLLGEPGALDRLGTVVVFLPQDLDPSAAALAAALGRRERVVAVAGRTGAARADEAVRMAVAAVSGRPVTSPGPAGASGATPPAPSPVAVAEGVEPTATRVLHASDCDDEVRCVVREVVAALRRVPAHRLAVLYAARDPYARLLEEHLAAAAVVTNGPGVRSSAERVLPRAFLQLLALPDERYGRAAVARLLAAAPVRADDGRLVPGARWDRVSRDAGVVAAAADGPGDWDDRLLRYAQQERRSAAQEAQQPEPRAGRIEGAQGRARDADDLRAFVGGLRRRLDSGQAARGWPALSGWALETYTAVLGSETQRRRMPPAEAAAGDRVEAVLRGLAGLGPVEADADLPLLREVLEVELAADVPRRGVYGTGVLVAPLHETVGLDADEVLVVGLAEGLYPTRPGEDALLPDEARAASGELPAVRERLDRQHRHLLAAFAAAPTVTASFPRGDLRRSGERLPSRWLLPTLRTLTGRPDLMASEWAQAAQQSPAVTASPSFATTLAATRTPATVQEWRVRALAGAGAGSVRDAVDDVARRGIDLLDGRRSDRFTRYDGNLLAHAGSLPDPADPARTVSPTSLERWTACPHAYFVGTVLRVDPVEQPEELLTMTPAERGTLLHEALDRFFRALLARDEVPSGATAWTPEQRAQLQGIGAGVADEAEKAGSTGHPTLWERERRLVLGDLDRVLDVDEQLRAEHGRTQVRSELTFGRRRPHDPDDRPPGPAVEVSLGDGRTVRFTGSADRVDVTADGSLVVTDYKSGKADAFKGLGVDDPDRSGSKLQLPVYAYAARAAMGRPDAPVCAEYWFIGRRDRGTRIGYPLTADVEERFRMVLRTVVDGVAAGVYPANVPEDQPWAAWVACAYCDPDGLGASERRLQWERKKSDPALAAYVALVEPGTAT